MLHLHLHLLLLLLLLRLGSRLLVVLGEVVNGLTGPCAYGLVHTCGIPSVVLTFPVIAERREVCAALNMQLQSLLLAGSLPGVLVHRFLLRDSNAQESHGEGALGAIEVALETPQLRG
jgi:hypothetical protein